MAKLKLNNNNKLVITQSDGGDHGADQGFKAFDFQPFDLVLNTDCNVTLVAGRGQLQYFNCTLGDGSIIQCVHGKPTKGLGFYNAGDIIGRVVPYTNSKGQRADHWHIAIRVKGIWYRVLDYIDRNVVLDLSGAFNSQKWKSWTTYNDFQLNITTNNPQPQMTNQKLIDAINSGTNFDRETKRLLSASVSNDDAGYLIAFAGDAVRGELNKVNSQIESLTTENLGLQKELEEAKKVQDVRIIDKIPQKESVVENTNPVLFLNDVPVTANFENDKEDLKKDLETAYKAIQDLVKKSEKFDWNILVTGVVSFKNAIANVGIVGVMPALFTFYESNQVNLSVATFMFGSGFGILYPLINKYINKNVQPK